MNALGWCIMITSWLCILLLCGFCFVKILLTSKKNIHAPLDIDTHDTPDAATPQA
jgi:hypothetical protein